MSNSPINLMKQAMSTLLAQSTVAGQPDTKPVDKPLPQPHDDVSIPEQNSILLPSGYSKFSGSQLAELSERRAEFIQGYETLGQTEKKLSQSFNIAFISLILGDGGKYLTWSAKAIANAAMLPGGSELAVPVTKGDLFAIEGKYEEAVVEYEKAIQTLSIIGKKGEDVTAEISAIQGRMKQVLFADASVSLNQSRGQFDLPSRDRTVGNLKMIYQLDPSETNLAWIFMAYAKLGWDLYDLQGRVEGSEKALQNYQSEMWEHFIETGRGQLAYISNDDLLSDPSLSDTEFLHLLRVDLSISMAQMDLDLYRPEFERIVSEIKTMIETTLKDDAQEKDLQLADLYAHIGDTDKLRRNLFFAHSAFQTLKKFHPEKVTKEKLTKDITCLHRLFTLQRRDYSEKAKILAEAKSEITSLLKFGETEEALLFLLENAYLSADLNEDLSLQRFEMKLTTQEEFQSEVKRGYTKAIQLAKMNISKMKNPEMKARFVQMMLDVGTTLFEKELSESTLLRLQGETEKASKVKSRAKSKLDAEFETYGGSVDQIMLEELRGQADYSYAYFLFRSGEIRSSILHLMNIDQNLLAPGYCLSRNVRKDMYYRDELPL